MASDDLVSCITRSSTAMIMIVRDKQVQDIYEDDIQLHSLFQCWENWEMKIYDNFALNKFSPKRALGRFENNFQNVFFKLISGIDTLSNSCENVLRRMPQNPSDDKSTLVQIMAWCRQATSHYLSQCWPRPMSSNGVTRPQWVNGTRNDTCFGCLSLGFV